MTEAQRDCTPGALHARVARHYRFVGIADSLASPAVGLAASLAPAVVASRRSGVLCAHVFLPTQVR